MSSQIFINKGHTYDPLLPWLGEGLLTAAGIFYQIFYQPKHEKLVK